MKIFCLSLLVLISTLSIGQNQPTPAMIRQAIAGDIKSLNIEPESIFKIENETVDQIAVRIYYPSAAKNLPIIYNIHGGALVAGDLDTHDNISRKLANATNSIVIAVDYRKAPENPYPQSLNDVNTVYSWIISNPPTNASNAPIAIVSDSGGCLLAAALQVQIAQKKSKRHISKVVYINPAFDLRNPGDGMYGLVTKWYLSGANPDDALVSPIITNDFSAFAPALIVVNEKDILLPHGIEFAKKLTAENIKNDVITIKGEEHFGGFWSAAHPKTAKAFDASIQFLIGK